ncbi:MAG: hypothetical protein IJP03_03920, partial [Christensenellaceae bacterium]|nr:hypothetical protein [Christensenellaceae bacterium]
ADKSVLLEAQLQKIKGVTIVSETTVDVWLQIEEKRTEKSFESIAITAANLDSGYRATLSVKHTDVKLEGGATAVKNVVRGDVKLYVDLADLTPGTYVLPVKVEAIDGISSSDITLTRASVTVTIEKR